MRFLQVIVLLVVAAPQAIGALRAGAARVDVTPEKLPVIRNGGFIEAQARLVSDPLSARALVLENNGQKVAIVVVDSCMMDREFCDRVKEAATGQTGIARDKILLSATHTHSAPSVMDFCLGSRKDPVYAEFLPGKIVEAIVAANARLEPASAAWQRFDAGDFTKTRRWVFRGGTERKDPFGEATVRANMHPGYQNPDAVGETGPADPWFTLLSFRDSHGQPLALLGNFSMHYFAGHAGLSADYFGEYVRAISSRLAPGDPEFVAILSQGTSGDLWRADYSQAKPEVGVTIEDYSGALADLSVQALEGLEYRDDVALAMAEKRITIARRTPGPERLEWARNTLEKMGGERPKNQQQVYAEQAVYLHENPQAELVLQTLRIGGLGLTAMPNEVYALTGLKLKHRSPLDLTMNIELANGASGYVPPPEQFPLGGYNTWPARTAGLIPQAETLITEGCLQLLEQVSGRERREYREPVTPYAMAVLKAKPKAFWRLGDLDGGTPRDDAAGQLEARYQPDVLFHLPGVGESFGAHFAGGRLAAEMGQVTEDFTTAFWFWNGVRTDTKPVTAYLFSRGPDGDAAAAGEHLGIGGTHSHQGKLFVYNGNERGALLAGTRELSLRHWHHVVLVRRGAEIVVYLDGREEIRGELPPTHGGSRQLFFGGRNDNFCNLEGRMDEIAFFDRAMTDQMARSLFAASAALESPPLSPQDSQSQIHVKDGFQLELVAAEPLVMDPVAVDWAEDGSVFVAEMADYPYGVEGGGRVARLLDTNGDGQLDKREDFLAGLSFPAGVMAWGKGVIVTAAPDILYAEDRDGDGIAEHVEKWFSGFIEGNQQLRVNGLRLGLDGWIYCASGGHHAGFGTKTIVTSHKTGVEVTLGSRDFRFKPAGSIEPESGPSQFGRVRDDFGNWFGVQNALPLWHYVLPDRYLRRNADAPAPDPRRQLRDHQPRLYPAKATQKRFHGFDHVGRYTSACGISIYRDELLFPRAPGEEIAFTCAPFHNLVQRHVLKSDGVSFVAERADDGEIDFFASRDRWCRPVMSRTAPDGSLWIVDMYRYMIEHPDWLPPEGKDELRPHYRAGEDRGRIYRIFPIGQRPTPFAGLAENKTEIGSNGIVNDLVMRAQGTPGVSSNGSASAVAAAVACGLVAPLTVLDHADARVRALAIRFLENNAVPPDAPAFWKLADDPSGQVRLQLAFSLGEWSGEMAAQCLAKLALADGADPYMRAAVLSSAKPHFQGLFATVIASEQADDELVASLVRMAPEQVAIRWLANADQPGETQMRSAASWLMLNGDAGSKFGELFGQAESIARDPSQSLARRCAALTLLVERDKAFPDLADAVQPQLVRAVIAACCERNLAAEVVARWPSFSPQTRTFAIDAALQSGPNIRALFAGLQDGLSLHEFSPAQRQRLTSSKDPAIRARAESLFGSHEGGRVEVIRAYAPALELEGDVARGRTHFRKNCASCHLLEGEGQAVGPDLLSITSRAKPDLLNAIIEPNRNVEPRYLSYTAIGDEEKVIAFGMIAAETATSVIFKLPDGSEKTVARNEIRRLDGIGRSLMPDGLEVNLDRQSMADLLSYLVSVIR